jgi:hypothetical protein
MTPTEKDGAQTVCAGWLAHGADPRHLSAHENRRNTDDPTQAHANRSD